MASDAAAREAEVGALCAIFGDAVEWARAHAWEAGGEGWCGTVTVRLRAADHPVVLLCHLGASYPTRAPPTVEVLARWMPAEQTARLVGLLAAAWERAPGDAVLFGWIDAVKDAIGADDDAHAFDSGCGGCGGGPDAGDDAEGGRRIAVRDVQDEEAAAATFTDGVARLGIVATQPFTDRRSTFQGFAARVRTAADAADVMRVLRSDRKIARATHNMMAYRCLSAGGAGAGVVADNDEDGEDGAGSRLAQLLSSAGVADAIVVVSRWYGGIKLGPDRFKHIGNIAREALVLGGFVVDGAGKRARR